MSMMQLVSVAEEAGLNFTSSASKYLRRITHGIAQFQVDYIEEHGDKLVSSRSCGFEPQQRRCVVASKKYLINCLVLVQPDFEINEVLNSIIIVRVRCGGRGGGGFLPLNLDFWSFKALIKVKVR